MTNKELLPHYRADKTTQPELCEDKSAVCRAEIAAGDHPSRAAESREQSEALGQQTPPPASRQERRALQRAQRNLRAPGQPKKAKAFARKLRRQAARRGMYALAKEGKMSQDIGTIFMLMGQKDKQIFDLQVLINGMSTENATLKADLKLATDQLNAAEAKLAEAGLTVVEAKADASDGDSAT